MKVRSKLALATGLGLLLLLGVFYVGGRMVIVGTLRQASRNLLHALPELRRTVRGELDRLEAAAQAAAMSALLQGLSPGEDGRLPASAGSRWTDTVLDHTGVDLFAVAGRDGKLLCAFVRDDGLNRPTAAQQEEIQRLLQPDATLVAGFHQGAFEAQSGLSLLAAEPLLVAVAPILPAGTASPAHLATVLVGRRIGTPAMMRRITSGLPLQSTVQQAGDFSFHPGVTGQLPGEVVGGTVQYDVPAPWRANEPMRARLPLYDIHGQPAFALTISLGYSFKGLADLALAWLILFVAGIGALFILPLLLVQGHTVLNPLTRLVDDLQALGQGMPSGRRLAWARQDEFGVVAATIDRILAAIDHEHQALVQRNEHMRALLAASPDLILVIDREGTLVDITNHSGGALAAYFSQTRPGDNVRQLEQMPAEAIEAFLRRVAEADETSRLQIFEYCIRHDGGGMSWAEFRMVRLSDNRILVMIRDITARHRAQHERARIEEKMAQMQKTESLGVLARGMAHDFNNILTAMLGHVDMAVHEPLTPPAREAVENIRLAMIRASNLTRQMLSYAGQGSFTFAITDLNLLLRDLVNLMRRSLAPQAELILAFGSPVPLVEADATQIWQVVMNLLVNASDAMASLSGTITLATTHATPSAADLDAYLSAAPLPPGDYAMIEVSDTGHGMDKRTIERIYDPFFTTKAMGRGLGLSACLGIVRAHNGGITVSSRSGEGTRFRILLPAARDAEGRIRFPAEAGGGPAAGRSPEPAGARDLSPPRAATGDAPGILVVDDDPAILKLVGIILAGKGYTVIAAESGEEALRLYDKDPKRIRLAVVDATTNGGLSGIEICSALHARSPRLPTIIMSGFREKEVGLDFTEGNFTGFLAKPFMSAELLAAVEKACRTATDPRMEPLRRAGGHDHGAVL